MRLPNPNKMFIKQYIINDKDIPSFLTENYDTIIHENKLVGYLFITQKVKSYEPTKILNLYLISRKHYHGPEIFIGDLVKDWESFLIQCKCIANPTIFYNPPLELWLESKHEWCLKTASHLATKFGISQHEALSHLYFAILKCIRKNDVYIGSLNYLVKAAVSEILMTHRSIMRRITTESGKGISLNSVLGTNSDGDDILLEDIIAATEDTDEESLSYRDTLEAVQKLMSKDFSPREIEQIILLEGSEIALPYNLYHRLVNWRKKHNRGELYD